MPIPEPLRPLPRAGGHWLLGSAREMREAPHQFVADLGARHGGLARFRILHRRMIAVTHPEYLRHILVTRHDRYERSHDYRASQATVGRGLITTDGEYWKLRRRQIEPAFNADLLEKVVPATLRAVAEMCGRWEHLRRREEPVPIVSETQTLSLTIMCRALLSVGIDSAEARTFGGAVRDSLDVVRRRNTSLCPMPPWVPNATNRALRATRDALDEFLTPHLRRRQAPGAEPHADLLQGLLRARDPETGEGLPWQALLDETKTLFSAGFETTATTLAWALHCLSQHPECMAAWHAEVDEVLGERVPTGEDVDRLTYTTHVVQETLRLFPPVYNLGRECVTDDVLDGYPIGRGETLLLSIYGAHRHPEHWADPERFDPSRFAPGRSWPKHAYLPFAAGKHQCIGDTLAMTEATLALALIGQRYRLQPTLGKTVPIRAQVTLLPAVEIPVHVETR